MRVTTGHQVAQPVNLADARERKALNERFGPPRPGFDHAGQGGEIATPLARDGSSALTCLNGPEPGPHGSSGPSLVVSRSPRLDRATPHADPRTWHGDDFDRDIYRRNAIRTKALTNAEEMARGRIGAARLHREEHEVWPYVVLSLCCLVLVGLILWVGW